MKTKFTQGEWRQSHRIVNDNGDYSTQVYDEEGETICTLAWHKVPYYGGVKTDREANAKLIAAAPDLLEVAISISSMQGRSWRKLDKTTLGYRQGVALEQAIKKATS